MEERARTVATKLIRLEDGILIEVQSREDELEAVSSATARRVDRSIDLIRPILVKATRSVVSAWAELEDEAAIEEAELELGVSFEGEGNAYIAKIAANANLTIRVRLKPRSS